MVSTMSPFTTYLREGLDLAVALANVTSRHRQGAPAPRGDTATRTAFRVGDAASLQHLSQLVRSIVVHAEPAAAAGQLNDLLRHYRAAPELAPDASGHWRLHLHPADSDGEALDAVKAATSLAALIDQGEWGSIRTCAAERCDNLFHDESRNHGRRYCTKSCANRMNAAHSRARRS